VVLLFSDAMVECFSKGPKRLRMNLVTQFRKLISIGTANSRDLRKP
jgi:hypothetical protein